MPLLMLSLHAFSNHEHGVCISKVETHLHEKEVDCNLHLLKQNETFLPNNTFEIQKINANNTEVFETYIYLKQHPQLSYSLRGPPVTI